jgi:putative PIN family toxin of toxin-antitoxin system
MLALDTCEICGCEQMITELAEVLNRSYFDRRLTRQDRDAFIAMIRNNFEMYWVDETVAASLDPPCRDASDNFILALALAAQADAAVSSDQDLLVLHPWRGIAIVTPAQFLEQFVP